ncbi:MAG: nucleotidyl transferase AbiEii/AbiGii toxin family protein [Deltaproteobacteria bacterium]|nr:nucleotidyl transferase AbiEii/AbiGii toxin family protein [Deltaproteobacteria bacterium]
MRSLHEQEAFNAIAFMGGTALRFLEGLPRFSEDLDFSISNASLYLPETWLKKLQTQLRLAGFTCSIKWKKQKTVNVAWLGFTHLMHDANLATRIEQQLSIKLEIDTKPPAGAILKRSIINKYMTFALCHYDLESLMAGKVHALLMRPYPKGRDWFDLIWYRAHRPPIIPNLKLLQNALAQTQKTTLYHAAEWQKNLQNKLLRLNINELKQDVAAFLERPEDRSLLSQENLQTILTD